MQVRSTNVMMSVIGWAVTFGGAALLAGCPGEHQDHTRSAEPQTAEPREAQPEAAEPLGRLVQANFTLVDALADDDLERARQAVDQTRQALAQVEEDQDLQASVQTMDQALQQMAGADDLAAMRRHFEPFSDELTGVVRTHGAGSAGPIYRAMCPMVQGRQAYWLQPQRPITNPYWGEAMYRCGEITETLVEPRE